VLIEIRLFLYILRYLDQKSIISPSKIRLISQIFPFYADGELYK